MRSVLKDGQHRNLAFWGMAMIAMGLPLSVFLVSVGSFVLAGNWLLEGNFSARLKRFFTDPLSLVLSSLFFLHCLGLLWTEDIGSGLNDLRVKLPLFLMPLFIFTGKLPDNRRIQDILLLFVVACVVGTLFGVVRFFELTDEELLDNRQISVFISHIRFGLMLVLAYFILAYLLYAKWCDWSATEKVICALTMFWILWFLIILEAFTAYVAFGAILLLTALWALARQQNRTLGIGLSISTLCLIIFGSIYVGRIVQNHFREVPFDYRTLTIKTVNGNYYAHHKDTPFRENGHRVWNFVCWKELAQEWPKRSSMDFGGTDKRGQELKFTLIRYMSSKGLLKDSVGMHQLSNADIENIEHGYTNYLYTDRIGVSRRISEFLRGWDKYRWERVANSNSSFQRLVYFEVGSAIFGENLMLGVGTGDMKKAYRQAYLNDDRGLEKANQDISHNQFLTLGITLGLLGLCWFLATLAYPFWLYRKDYLYAVFFVLMIVSFMTDNTLERQAGATLYAFFNALLIVRREFSQPH